MLGFNRGCGPAAFDEIAQPLNAAVLLSIAPATIVPENSEDGQGADK